MNRVPEDRLDYDEDSGTYRFEGLPFEGVAYSLSAQGWLISEQHFREGLPWGVGRSWFGPDRQATESSSVGGVWHGTRREWHENGRLALEEFLELGVTLRRKTWDEQGNPVEDYVLKDTSSDYQTLSMLRKHDARLGWTDQGNHA